MTKKKAAVLVVSAALAMGCAIGGTVAWLTSTTAPVQNTFTTSNIDITLAETATDFQMIPGYEVAKDPVVTVEGGSEACWLFVKIDESANFDEYLTYGIAEGWTQGDGTAIPANVYYRAVSAADADQAFDVLAGNKVQVKDTVTKAMMEAAAESNPTLTFTAYASQYNKSNTATFSAAEAWTNIA